MDISYVYMKQRMNFGRQPMFCEFGPELCDTIPVNSSEHRQYILRNPVHTGVQNAPVFSKQYINTIRAEYVTTGINHAEGGWPRDVNVNDPEQTQRYRRKIEKDDGYIHCVMSLSGGMENLILQNNAIDMYEIYNVELDRWPDVERFSCRTANVYRDGIPTAAKRPVSSIAWRPEAMNQFAVTYVDVDFNRDVRSHIQCLLWDVENANTPEVAIIPPYALLDLQYNPRHVEMLAGGMINGQVAIWDQRTNMSAPNISCPPHEAHRDLVRAIRFINAKSGMEFFSGGPDGAVKWWDIRNMNAPTDEMIIDTVSSANDVPSMARSMGICSLEYEATIPSRFMVGTENGFVISGNRKGKSPVDKLPGKYPAHNGPVWTVERNPGFLKNFLTCGDWTARIWSEECRESAILWTPGQRHKITHAAWSPQRLSLFMITQANGQLTIWDLLRRQTEPVLTKQVCEEPLLRVVPHEAGTFVALGTAKGSVYLQELSQSLTTTSKNEKAMLTAMFDRENKRERILEARLREIRVKARAAEEPKEAASEIEIDYTIGDKDLHEATVEFFQTTKKELAHM